MRRFDLLDILKVIRYPLFFLVVFFVFLVILFPSDRFIPVLESKLGDALERKVIIGDLSLSVFGGIDLEDVQIEIPVDPKAGVAVPDDDDEEDASSEQGDASKEQKNAEAGKLKRPLFYAIDEIEIDIGLVALLFGKLAVDVELEIFDGSASLSYEGPIPGRGEDKPDRRKLRTVSSEPKKEDTKKSTTPVKIRIEVEGLALAQVHELRDKLPIPAVGQISLAADLQSKTGKMTDLNGEVGLVLEDLILGKAGGQIEVGGMPLSLDPIVVSGVELAIEVDDGLAEFSEFVTRSPDIDLKVQGSMTFTQPIARSRFDFYLMFNILEGYTKKSEVAKLLVANLEQFSRDMKRAKRDDGYYGFRYRGTVRNWSSARLLAAKTYRKRGERKERPRSAGDRPTRGSKSQRRAPSRFQPGGGGAPGGVGNGSPIQDSPLGSPMGGSARGRKGVPEPAPRPEKRDVKSSEVAEPPQEVVESEMEFDEEEVAGEQGDLSGGGEGSTAEEEGPGDEGEGASGDEEIEIEE